VGWTCWPGPYNLRARVLWGDQGTPGVGIESDDPWRTARAKALS
jgi:hypothetical protein